MMNSKGVAFIIILALAFIFAGIAHADLNDWLVAYYPFNGNANDESGNGNNGTAYGGISYVDGVMGQAASLDGINDYIRISQSDTLNNLQTMTITYWIKYYKPVSGDSNVAVTICNGEDKPVPFVDGFYTYACMEGIHHYLGKWGDATGVCTPIDATVPVSEQSYTFVVFLVTEDKIKTYKNGNFIEENDREGRNISRPQEDWYIGRNGSFSMYYLNGHIDDIRIYNRALTDSEIKTLSYVSPPSHDYGIKAVDYLSTQLFTFTNTSSETITLGTLSITGTDNAEFYLQSDNCSGIALEPSESSTFEVVFEPASLGAKAATVNIPSNLGIDALEVSLRGLVTEPCECDLNNDGSCNVFDWYVFIEDWGRTDCSSDCECDLNNDGSCNVFDWFIFIEDWGRTDCPVN